MLHFQIFSQPDRGQVASGVDDARRRVDRRRLHQRRTRRQVSRHRVASLQGPQETHLEAKGVAVINFFPVIGLSMPNPPFPVSL